MIISAAMSWRRIGGKFRVVLFLVSLIVAALWWSHSNRDPSSQDPPGQDPFGQDDWTPPAGRPHIVFILIDTLRLDHTNIGGYHRDTTPGLELLAQEGLKFDNHFSNAPWTKSSVATILTGLLPGAHGAQWGQHTLAATRKVDVLSEGFETLPEVLQRNGYSTHAFMTNPTLSSSLGYAQGFDEYLALSPRQKGDRRAVARTKRALDEAKGPTFVWCHLMAVHNYKTTRRQKKFESKGKTPISKTAYFGRHLVKKYGQKYHEGAIDSYDNTVLVADGLVRNLTEFIRKNHPDTLIIITSDHGEEFLDHGGYLHARTLYNELLRVPLVLLGPAIPRGRSISRLTDHADLFATVLDYLGLPLPATQGESLLRRQAEDAALIYAEKRNGAFAQRALISEEGKFIEQKPRGKPRTKPSMEGEGTLEFYRDPAGLDDQNTLDELAPAAIDEARAQFERIWAENQKILQDQTRGHTTQRDMTDEEAEALRDLGYVE
jgi:arylsulfatase A-like enzyme